MSVSWINKLNESDSRLHKEAVLTQALTMTDLGHVDTIRFLSLLKACYNPFITFGVKAVPVTDGLVDRENPWDDFQALLGELSHRALTGHAARDAIVAMSTRFDTDEWNVFCRPIILKDVRAGVSEKTINKVCKKTDFEIPVFGCQLATDSVGNPNMVGNKRLEMKLDGVRVLMMVIPSVGDLTVISYSRNGKVYDNFQHIEKQIQEKFWPLVRKAASSNLCMGFVFDGEVVGKSFNDLMKQARRKTDAPATDSVFTIFDIIPLDAFREGHWNAQLTKRVRILDDMSPIINEMPNVKLLPHIIVDLDTSEGKDQFHRFCKDMVEQGFEGAMIKDMKAPYECKRNTSWMKFKPVITVDLEVVGIEEGTGRNEGRLGALVCSGVDSGKTITVNCGSGFSDEQRTGFWVDREIVIGQTAEVMADAVSQNQDGTYSLRFPRFVRFRDDK